MSVLEIVLLVLTVALSVASVVLFFVMGKFFGFWFLLGGAVAGVALGLVIRGRPWP
jgi:hypothetical protein